MRSKFIRLAALLAILTAGCCMKVHAQALVKTTPESDRETAFSAVNAPGTFIVRNIGQNVHIVNYFFSGPGSCTIQIRMEATQNGTNWFPISNDIVDTGGAGDTNTFVAAGYYLAERINLVGIGCVAGTSVTVNYTGTSSGPVPASLGVVNPAQGLSRTLFSGQSSAANASKFVQLSTGSTEGFIVITNNAAWAGNCTLKVNTLNLGGVSVVGTITLTGANTVNVMNVPKQPAALARVDFTACGASATTFSATYFLTPQGFNGLLLSNPAAPTSPPSFESPFICDKSTVITVAGAGTLEVAALVASQKIRVCHISVAYSGATNFQIIEGTGAACAGTPANKSGNYLNVTAVALDFGMNGALRSSAGFALCIVTSAAVTGGGVITYAQY